MSRVLYDLGTMSWTNPQTLRELPYSTDLTPRGFGDWDDLYIWCLENLGEQGEDWSWDREEMLFPHRWHFSFSTAEKLALFTMVWG